MDCNKVGSLIFKLRKEKNLTQKQLADIMNISDKTISKWERGLGCPDVSLLGELSQIFNVHIEKILSGDLESNNTDGGNMKKIKFYMCPTCGNVITATSEADVACCGRKLISLELQNNEEYDINIETVENDYYITFSHEMSKEHYISFVAYVAYDRVMLIKLYPEQSSEVRLPKFNRGKLYFACNQHGMMMKEL
ncbi:MAG: helix-turn-helix domain-containing protein [Eubacteriales bacterium]|nr:helix-turn-helix domain-containing protein [Eubacteriales bacterium]